jgi:cardiolipin synthase
MSSDSALLPYLTLHGLVTTLAVLWYVVASHVMGQRRSASAAIAWVLFIFLLPYLALPAFLAFGSRKLARPRLGALPDLSGLQSADAWAIETIVAFGQPSPAAYRELNVHPDGLTARDALLECIDGAQASIDLCTFILRRDRLGNAVIERLCRKARAGVRVRLLLDGLGSMMEPQPDLKALIRAGGQVKLFAPPLRSPFKERANLRNHRKLLVADGALTTGHLWCGGRNLAAEYFDGRPGEAPWQDLSVDLRGPLVRQASALFDRDWAFANGRPPSVQMSEPAGTPSPTTGAQLVASGPDQADDTIYALLVTAGHRARKRIALATPYFVPGSALLMALCLAARRGVSVDLLLPARSNHRLSDMARNRALRALAAAGGRTWLASGMLHAKLAVIDDALALVGSANLDSRSLFLNYEVMLAFHDAGDVRRFAAWFDQARTPATAYVAAQPGLVRDVAEGMLLWLGFQL